MTRLQLVLALGERFGYHDGMIPANETAALTRVNEPGLATKILFERLALGPLPHWNRVVPRILLRKVEQGGTIFPQDADHPFAYVVKSGLIKNVYLNANGESWIKSFAREGGFFASIAALKPGGRTSFQALAIEDSEVERIAFDALEQLAETEAVWANVLRRAIMIFAERKEARERAFLTLRPEDRYRQFVAEAPGLEARIAQKDIAAFLGVTPVGLNRIIKRVRKA